MTLPAKYKWLTSLRGQPNTIRIGLSFYGVQEVAGKGSNATIISWRDELNLAGAKIVGFSEDAVPWCGLFAALVAYRRIKNPSEVVKDPLWARNWTKYGIKSPEPSLGDILVFERGSGGHVGFYVAEDATAYHVLGGNQSDQVCITRVLKNRMIACRRPLYLQMPKTVKPYRVTANGTISTNEA